MKPLKREDRRSRTEAVATRRFKRIVDNVIEEPESIGLFKKNSGMSIKKDSSRAWNKIRKEKNEKIKELRRNGIPEIETENLN